MLCLSDEYYIKKYQATSTYLIPPRSIQPTFPYPLLCSDQSKGMQDELAPKIQVLCQAQLWPDHNNFFQGNSRDMCEFY